jgi:hypothetical protein
MFAIIIKNINLEEIVKQNMMLGFLFGFGYLFYLNMIYFKLLFKLIKKTLCSYLLTALVVTFD